MPNISAAPFPDGFLWGAAGSGHQIEGGNVNSDSWLVEHVEGTLFLEPSSGYESPGVVGFGSTVR